MASRLTGLARIEDKAERDELRQAKAAERAHLKDCARCHRAGGDPYRRCDYGWQLAKRVHRAGYQLDKRKIDDNERQGVLW